MTTIISNDKDLALIMAVATSGEEYLAENNGHIDLDDDDAVDAMVWQDIKNEELVDSIWESAKADFTEKLTVDDLGLDERATIIDAYLNGMFNN